MLEAAPTANHVIILYETHAELDQYKTCQQWYPYQQTQQGWKVLFQWLSPFWQVVLLKKFWLLVQVVFPPPQMIFCGTLSISHGTLVCRATRLKNTDIDKYYTTALVLFSSIPQMSHPPHCSRYSAIMRFPVPRPCWKKNSDKETRLLDNHDWMPWDQVSVAQMPLLSVWFRIFWLAHNPHPCEPGPLWC